MTNLRNVSDDELKTELARREIKKRESEKPRPMTDPNWSGVVALCISHIDDIERDERNEDTDHYIYESAMEAVFGKNVWLWINARM